MKAGRLIVTLYWSPGAARQLAGRTRISARPSRSYDADASRKAATSTPMIAGGQLLADSRRQFVTLEKTISVEHDSGNCDSHPPTHPQRIISSRQLSLTSVIHIHPLTQR